RCLGCGACVRACARHALSLRSRGRRPGVPRNAVTKFVRIAWEKGRLWPLLKAGLRSRLRGAP
ncbi:MAG TPA: 4Fe-4S ferredoxin, partial [Elusimicrobia bacterium]|nr:4Fe-4S ferredoxin [Elusimicrobiota bacterium]